jgi:hypothetical protein
MGVILVYKPTYSWGKSSEKPWQKNLSLGEPVEDFVQFFQHFPGIGQERSKSNTSEKEVQDPQFTWSI